MVTTQPQPIEVPVRAFMNLDAVDGRAPFYIRFLDVLHDLEHVRVNRLRTFDLLDARPGAHMLDVGCGLGSSARELAAILGPTGRVVGVDVSETMVGVARERSAGLDLPVEFHVADAHHLPFAADSFDGCRSERILQYLDDPGRAIAEMARVTRPGGAVVATEGDWDTIVCDLPGVDRELWRRMRVAASDSVGNPWMGRELPRRFREASLTDVVVELTGIVITEAKTWLVDLGGYQTMEKVREAGAITADEAESLIRAMEDADRAGDYFSAMTLFTVRGRA